MKRTFLAVLFLAVSLLAGGCNRGGSDNANTNTRTATATPLTANTDPALKTAIETELRKKGFNNITVDVTTTPATLRGTYPKGKLAEVIQTAQVANGGKPVKNEATEEK